MKRKTKINVESKKHTSNFFPTYQKFELQVAENGVDSVLEEIKSTEKLGANDLGNLHLDQSENQMVRFVKNLGRAKVNYR